MRLAAGPPVGAHLVVQRLPVPGEHMLAGDHDVDFARAGGDREFHLAQLGFKARQAGREARGHRGDGRAAVAQRAQGRRDHLVIDAHGPDLHAVDAQGLGDIGAQRPKRLAAQPVDSTGRVVAAERRQVHALDRLDQPGRLVCLLHRPPRHQAGRAAIGGVTVDAQAAEPVKIKGAAVVAPRIWRPGARHHARWSMVKGTVIPKFSSICRPSTLS